ncbi:Uncharacterized protein NEOC65_001239 [Neochlamydia sp. AcF65]|uniref:hypothetical protein n=1 Tax=Neochlamydia sp. AcF65 TaxID=2795735 RepID=UPI001BC93128|nr:hypothetical protein [Neochlamydia sp. AcF65]MBS4166159.1 Uncharacterized protein [Neochlamydia sp. AcF65]
MSSLIPNSQVSQNDSAAIPLAASPQPPSNPKKNFYSFTVKTIIFGATAATVLLAIKCIKQEQITLNDPRILNNFEAKFIAFSSEKIIATAAGVCALLAVEVYKKNKTVERLAARNLELQNEVNILTTTLQEKAIEIQQLNQSLAIPSISSEGEPTLTPPPFIESTPRIRMDTSYEVLATPPRKPPLVPPTPATHAARILRVLYNDELNMENSEQILQGEIEDEISSTPFSSPHSTPPTPSKDAARHLRKIFSEEPNF